MVMKPALSAFAAALLFAGIGSPAMAGQAGYAAGHWRATHRAIYEAENLIAFLEADPETDDGYKAPIINRARAAIWRLEAKLGPPQWRWRTPCCYSRKPIDIH